MRGGSGGTLESSLERRLWNAGEGSGGASRGTAGGGRAPRPRLQGPQGGSRGLGKRDSPLPTGRQARHGTAAQPRTPRTPRPSPEPRLAAAQTASLSRTGEARRGGHAQPALCVGQAGDDHAAPRRLFLRDGSAWASPRGPRRPAGSARPGQRAGAASGRQDHAGPTGGQRGLGVPRGRLGEPAPSASTRSSPRRRPRGSVFLWTPRRPRGPGADGLRRGPGLSSGTEPTGGRTGLMSATEWDLDCGTRGASPPTLGATLLR